MSRFTRVVGGLATALGVFVGHPSIVRGAAPPSPPATLEVVAVPGGSGIPYKWFVTMSRRQRVDLVLFVGAKSWSEPSNPDGLKGWTHTSNWIGLNLTHEARLKVTVERQQGVVKTDGTFTLARDRLVPAVSLYAGWDSVSDQDHVFNNAGDFWSSVQFVTNAPNRKGRSKIVLKTKKLPAGTYTLNVGGNPPSLGDPANYPVGGCDVNDATCYAYTGEHGYHALIEAR